MGHSSLWDLDLDNGICNSQEDPHLWRGVKLATVESWGGGFIGQGWKGIYVIDFTYSSSRMRNSIPTEQFKLAKLEIVEFCKYGYTE